MYFSIGLCFLPLIFGILIFTLVFKLRLLHQLLAVLLGLLAVLPISFLQFFMPEFSFLANYPVLWALFKSIVLYGLIEEAFKTLLIIPLPHRDYSARDFLFLSFVMGLSLGCFESVVYLFEYALRASERGAVLLYSQIFARIFTSDLIHLACTGLCGLFVNSCRQGNRRLSCLVLAVLLHGFYDFFAGFQNSLRLFAFAVILLALIECRIKYTALAPQDTQT